MTRSRRAGGGSFAVPARRQPTARDGSASSSAAAARAEMLSVFGERLRELRSSHGWTSERLAQESSLTVSSVSNIERALQEPRLSTLLLLIETLGVRPEELLSGIPVPRKARAEGDEQ
jgi:ribosome-binding protein aMBF1 (putative translation factor)